MGTAVALRGEEPPANVLRSSCTCCPHPCVSERQSGFVVWAQLAGKYRVLLSPAGGSREGGTSSWWKQPCLSLKCLFPGMGREGALPRCVGSFLKWLVMFPCLPPQPWMLLCLSSRLILDRALQPQRELQVNQGVSCAHAPARVGCSASPAQLGSAVS